METLTKAGVVTALEHSPRDGRALAWQIPEGFESRAIDLDLKQGRASGATLLSVQDLNAQLASPGATWLDRAQVGWDKLERICAPQSAFRKEMKEAFRQRQEWLVESGHAEVSRESDGKTYVTYKRGYVKSLEAEGFNDATQKIEDLKNKPFVAAQAGRLLEGTVSQKFELTHGPHAMIETQRAFCLVPWQSVHAQTWGKRIRGRVLSVGGIDWDAGRSRGIGR